jgi:hypothetical protein
MAMEVYVMKCLKWVYAARSVPLACSRNESMRLVIHNLSERAPVPLVLSSNMGAG